MPVAHAGLATWCLDANAAHKCADVLTVISKPRVLSAPNSVELRPLRSSALIDCGLIVRASAVRIPAGKLVDIPIDSARLIRCQIHSSNQLVFRQPLPRKPKRPSSNCSFVRVSVGDEDQTCTAPQPITTTSMRITAATHARWRTPWLATDPASRWLAQRLSEPSASWSRWISARRPS